MSEEPIVKVEPSREAVVVATQVRRLDHDLTGKLKNAIGAAAARHPQSPLVLEMSSLEFVPSVALGALVELNRVLSQGRQRLLLAGMNRQIRATFAVSRLDKILEIHENVEAALAALRKAN